ncbi:MAG: hypothetical protein AB1772_08460 [Candidatus Zixiibacteriota bacterium]
MRVTKGLFIGVVATGLGLACLWPFGCDDNPTKPPPVEAKNYVFYWNRYVTDSTFFGYHTLTGEIDSFFIPGTQVYDMNVSADGRRLFISYSDKTRVFGTEDYKPIVDLPYSGWYGVAVSPDNRYVAVQSGNLRIISSQNYSVVYQDTLGVNRSIFSANGSRLYAPGASSSCRSIYRLDLEKGFESDSICIPDDFPVFRVVPSRDEKLLFIFRSLGNCYMYLDVFDVAGDSLMFRDLVAPGCGDMAVSPDKEHLYFTGPGDLHGWPPHAYSFARYHIGNKIIDSIWSASICEFSDPTPAFGSDLALTPDGRTLAITDGIVRNRLVLYDCQLQDTIRVLCFPGIGFWHVTCRNGR